MVPAQFVEKTTLFPFNYLCNVVTNQLTVYMGIYFWTLSLIYLSVFSVILLCSDDYSFIISLKIREYKSSNFVHLSQSRVGYSRSCKVSYKFWNKFDDFCKNTSGITGILWKLYILIWRELASFPQLCEQ